MPTTVRAVFFDAVGTLLQPHPPVAFVYATAARRHGSRLSTEQIAGRFRLVFRAEEDADRAAGQRTDEGREKERWRRIVATVLDDVGNPAACFAELWEHFGQPSSWEIDPELPDLTSALSSRGLKLGVASNFDGRLRSVLAGLSPRLLEHLVISSEVGWRKPAAEFYDRVREIAGLPGDAIVMVGDDFVNDFAGAREAGLRAVLLGSKGEDRPGVTRIGRLSELPGVLDRFG